jgi:hypothetical protein
MRELRCIPTGEFSSAPIRVKTWAIGRNGNDDQAIIRASSPADAVEKSLRATESRGSRTQSPVPAVN